MTTLRRYKVEFKGGEGRETAYPVNYMICNVNGVELYAEIDVHNVRDEYVEYWGYSKLKEEILRQAFENGVDVLALEFDW